MPKIIIYHYTLYNNNIIIIIIIIETLFEVPQTDTLAERTIGIQNHSFMMELKLDLQSFQRTNFSERCLNVPSVVI